jgi:hypothetical protein
MCLQFKCSPYLPNEVHFKRAGDILDPNFLLFNFTLGIVYYERDLRKLY